MLMMKKYCSIFIALMSVFCVVGASAEGDEVKAGLTEADWAYTLGDGVTLREVTWYSEGVACFGKIFFPKGFDTTAKTPGIVLGQGWAGTHYSIEKYAARFAERGLVAIAIDYRGWGRSNGRALLTTLDTTKESDDVHLTKQTRTVTVKRTQLIPNMQVQDYRNAISYLQGEPGVDADRIGIWGSSFAGGHTVTVAAQDARVKALVGQVPAISGYKTEPKPFAMPKVMLSDAIKRSREGQGAVMTTGFSMPREVDAETSEKVFEYKPFHSLAHIGKRPVLFIVAENEQLFNNDNNAKAAIDSLNGPKKYIVVPDITHFEMYIGEAFEMSSNAAADWFLKYLGTTK